MSNWFTRMFAAKPAAANSAGEASGAGLPAPQAGSPHVVDNTVVSVDRARFAFFGEAFPRVNEDELIARKGVGVYARMRTDEQVKAVVTFKRDAILSRGWTFEFDPDSKLSEAEKDKRKRVVEQIVRKLPGSFVDALNVIAVGREFGFSLTEKVYQQVEVDGATYTGLKGLYGRDPSTFNFYTDIHGDLVRCEQEAAGQRIDIDLAKFVHYVHNPEFDRWFGRSDLREAYRAWYSKDMILRFWPLFLERFGAGFLIAQLSPEANIPVGSAAYQALQDAVTQAKNGAGIISPPGVAIDVRYPATTEAFEKACVYNDLAIAKALLVPNLAGVSNTGQTGAYSQAQSQLEAFAWTLKADAERLQACVDEQLFADLGEQNWGDGEYPCFKFKPLSGEQLRWIVDTWAKMVQAGTVVATEKDEARLREILEMPPREEGDLPIAGPAVDPAHAKAMDAQDRQFQQDEAAKDNQVQRGIAEDRRRATDPVLSKAQQDARAAYVREFGYDPEQPRDDHGMWTAGHGPVEGVKPGHGPVDLAEGTFHPLKPSDPKAKRLLDAAERRVASLTGGAKHRASTLLDAVKSDLKEHGYVSGIGHSMLDYIGTAQAAHLRRFAYNPDEPRDESGKWTDSGSGGKDLEMKPGRTITSAQAKKLDIADAVKHLEARGLKVEVQQPKASNGFKPSYKLTDRHGNTKEVSAQDIKDLLTGKRRKFAISRRDASIALASARERVDFAVIDRKQADMAAELSRSLADTVARSVKKELGSDDDLAKLTDQDTSDIGQWQLPAVARGRIKAATQVALQGAWDLGRRHAQAEIRKTHRRFARGLFEFADLRDNAAAYFDSTAFKVSGDVSDRARSIIQQELLSSVKNGRSPAQTRTAIWERLVARGLTSPGAVRSAETDEGVVSALDALWVDTEEAAAAYLDTVARTNLFSAMNEARYAEFSDPTLSDFVLALRYSAVLDDHTTEICQALDDQVWETDNPLWDAYRPPNHFNCRSVLIPITAIDVEDGLWDRVESPEPTVEPQEGFGA